MRVDSEGDGRNTAHGEYIATPLSLKSMIHELLEGVSATPVRQYRHTYGVVWVIPCSVRKDHALDLHR